MNFSDPIFIVSAIFLSCSVIFLVFGVSMYKSAIFWSHDQKLREEYIRQKEKELGEKLDYYKGAYFLKPDVDKDSTPKKKGEK